MSENIAGYIDRSIVKGQAYRYAAGPKPMIATGININNISSDLLVKALYVNSSQSTGDFPGLGVFLITTVEYGNSTYLQTAISLSNGYEFKRIKAGSNDWTEWKDSSNGSVSTDLTNIFARLDAIDGTNGELSVIKKNVGEVGTTASDALSNAGTAWNLANSANQSANNISSRLSVVDVSNSYTITKTSGNWTIDTKTFYRLDNILYVYIVFKGNGSDVTAGSNGFVGTITGDRLPIGVCHLTGFYSKSTVIASINNSNGAITARVLSATCTLAKDTTKSKPRLGISGTVMLNPPSTNATVVEAYEEIPAETHSVPAMGT